MATEDEARQRRLALLSAYDDIDDDTNEDTSPSTAGNSNNYGGGGGGRAPTTPGRNLLDKTDLDSNFFSPEDYMLKLTKSSTMSNLITKRNELLMEIRKLDSEMQMLVYENYNKFIAATDTIRDMKDTVQDMEKKVVALSDNMASIGRTSENIDHNLAAGRAKIESLTATKRLLKKIEFLFQLPARLHKSVELKATAQAVRYYAISNRALRQYSHIPSFKAIQTEADEIIGKLKVQLRENIDGPASSQTEVTDAIQMLLDLSEPAPELRAAYIRVRSVHLRKALNNIKEQENTRRVREREESSKTGSGAAAPASGSSAAGSATGSAAAAGEDDDDEQHFLLPFIILVAAKFIALYDDFAKCYRRLFLIDKKKKDDSNAARAGGASTSSASQAANAALMEDRAEANRQLKQCTKELFADYFGMIYEHVMERTWQVEDLLKAMEKLSEDVALAHQLAPDAGLLDKKNEIIEKSLRGYISKKYWSVMNATVARFEQLNQLCNSGGQGIGKHTEDLGNFFVDQVIKVTESFDSLIRANSRIVTDYVNPLMTHIHLAAAETVSYVLELVPYLTEPHRAHLKTLPVNTPVPKFTVNPLIACAAVSFVMLLQDHGIRKIHGSITKMYKLKDKKMQFEATTRVQQAKSVATSTLAVFVETQGMTVAKIIRTGIENSDWLHAKEPRDVRASASLVTEEITKLQAFVSQLFGAVAASSASAAASAAARSRNNAAPAASFGIQASQAGRGAVESGIQRLFAGKVKIFGPVNLNTASIMMGIIKISFKTLVECVRLRTFSKFGLQKMQVDVHYWRTTLEAFASEEPMIFHSLLDDALRSAAERCLEPVPMEFPIVEAIVAKRLESGPRNTSSPSVPRESPPVSSSDGGQGGSSGISLQ